MDLEELARKLYGAKMPEPEIIRRLTKFSGSELKSQMILEEVKATAKINDPFIDYVVSYPSTGYDANVSGLGCRGEGDFLVHKLNAELIGSTGAIVDPMAQDDGGAIKLQTSQEDYRFIVAAIDGMHSRLSHFPFLAGFHCARAALRDVIVMGANPLALMSDIHLACNGDVGKIFDYTAGVAAVSELTDIPIISGSTLRIGGDLVLGDRLTGAIGAIGLAKKLTYRDAVNEGDVLIMTAGVGGGTIATTALYNGYHEVVAETLNIDVIKLGIALLNSEIFSDISSMTDVTNGGLRGDVYQIAERSGLKIVLNRDKIRALINPKVLGMLDALNIDYLGVSTDSLLIIVGDSVATNVLNFIRACRINADIVGRIEAGKNVFMEVDGELEMLKLSYREAPYTPVKRVAAVVDLPDSFDAMQAALRTAVLKSLAKKARIVEWVKSRSAP